MSERIERVLVLGAGYTGAAVLALARARGLHAGAVVRRPETAGPLRASGVEDVLVTPELGPGLESHVDDRTHVVITFPPDGTTDARVARAIPPAGHGVAAITYVSSTGVYGDRRGEIDDATPVSDAPGPSATKRLQAEETWRRHGATILRCPAIYGPDRGLHVRVLEGAHRIPGDGSSYVSRIHVEDLAALVLAAPGAPGETFVVGDAEPAPHRDVVAFVCDRHGVPMPPSVPLDQVHESLRGDRRVDGSRALARLGVELRYPSYRVGMACVPRS